MVIIVGAGPAGLATAYYLQQKNISYQILEKQTIGYAWQQHYDSLRLHTLKEVSALPGRPMPDHYPRFPTREQFLAYLIDYAQYFELNILEGVEVTNAIYHPFHEQWHIETGQGEFEADLLVAATGIWSTPYTPTFPGQETFTGRILHANDYQNAEPFANEAVLVVGAGNSGAEIAVEVAETAACSAILVRDGTTFIPFPESEWAVRVHAWLYRHLPDSIGSVLLAHSREEFDHLGLPWPDRPLTQVYPVVGFELPQAVEAGQVAVYQTGIERFTAERVVFEDGRSARFDAVIMATGYRPTLQFVARELQFDQKGWPVLKNWHSVKNDRLYCVGYNYPSTEGWLQAIPRVAKQAVDHLASKVKHVQQTTPTVQQ